MNPFVPNYKNIEKAAWNIKPDRLPLYEHIISESIMEKILNKSFASLINGDEKERKEYFRQYNRFFKEMGYDTVTMERCISDIMPGAGALGKHIPGVIKDRVDFERYPWSEIKTIYFNKYANDFELLREFMPAGMKGIGGPGNGIFECVQDLTGYMDLCYIRADDPELYSDLYAAVGKVHFEIWEEFMKRYSDIYCVCRFGDDLGYRSGTLIDTAEIRKHIFPHYKNVVKLVHTYNKPFLLHSCGQIFDLMDSLISDIGINAKHSNEDQIALFTDWVNLYGDRIGNFGGIDMNDLCMNSEQEIKETVNKVIESSINHKGFALGSGNSITDYVPVSGYLAMVEAVRQYRKA